MKHAVKTTHNEHRTLLFINRCSLFTCALVLFCSITSARALVLPRTAKLLPPETVVLVDIDDFNQLKLQFEKTSLYKFYKDPAMAGFIEHAKAKWCEKIGKLDENDIFKTITDADVLPKGRLAVALVTIEQAKDSNEPPVLFITQWGQTIAKIKEAVKKMTQKNVELGGRQKRSEDYRGVTIESMVDEKSSTFSYCFIDDCFLGSSNTDLLKFVIAHIKGSDSPTLASDTDYLAVIGAVGPYHDIDFYVNIKQIIKKAIAQDSTGSTRSLITNLGLDSVTSAGCSIGLARNPGSSCSGKAFVKIEGARKGICKILELEPVILKAPRFIPASAYSTMFCNLNIKKAYDELYSILYSFNPAAAAVMHVPILPPSPTGEPGLQLKADIIDHLGSQVLLTQSIKKPFSDNAMPTDTFTAVAVNNRAALEKSLSLLHGIMIAANNPDARRELLGHTIYLIDMQGLPFLSPRITPLQDSDGPGPAATAPMPKFAFTITDTHLILGLESTVEGAIRTLSGGSTTSVDSAKWFTTARSSIPSVVGLAYFEDNSAQAELLWWLVKQSGGAKTSSTSAVPNPALGLLQTGFDFSLLPEFDVVRKYFGSSASYGLSRPDGLFFEFRDIDPTGPN